MPDGCPGGTEPPWRPFSVAWMVAMKGTFHRARRSSPAHATSQSWAWTRSGRQSSSAVVSCTTLWLAELILARKLSSGSHGRSVRARSTRTPSTTESSGTSGWWSVRTTTSWPARTRARDRPSTWAARPPTTSGGYSQLTMAIRIGADRSGRRDGPEVVADELTHPPVAGSPALGAGGVAVPVEAAADPRRRVIGERVGAEELQRRLVAFEQFGDEGEEPSVGIGGRQRREPHQPV